MVDVHETNPSCKHVVGSVVVLAIGSLARTTPRSGRRTIRCRVGKRHIRHSFPCTRSSAITQVRSLVSIHPRASCHVHVSGASIRSTTPCKSPLVRSPPSLPSRPRFSCAMDRRFWRLGRFCTNERGAGRRGCAACTCLGATSFATLSGRTHLVCEREAPFRTDAFVVTRNVGRGEAARPTTSPPSDRRGSHATRRTTSWRAVRFRRTASCAFDVRTSHCTPRRAAYDRMRLRTAASLLPPRATRMRVHRRPSSQPSSQRVHNVFTTIITTCSQRSREGEASVWDLRRLGTF